MAQGKKNKNKNKKTEFTFKVTEIGRIVTNTQQSYQMATSL